MKITVVGIGYVGLSNGILLAGNNEVTFLDTDQRKIKCINARISPLEDPEASSFLKHKCLNLSATNDKANAYFQTDYIIISVPTNYDEKTNYFDTSILRGVIADALHYAPEATIVIKSTVPIGFTDKMNKRFGTNNIIFSPEFLREGTALLDNLYPSRIVIGEQSARASLFGGLLAEGAEKEDIDIIYTGSSEAEAIKLFANAYLAMRVGYFNEIDSYMEKTGLHADEVISGMCADDRIGDYYNNPSFGYGGICFPKDTKQLLANFKMFPDVPCNLIESIVKTNDSRKHFIAEKILQQKPKTVGIYRLIMKKGSDNFRDAAIFDIIEYLEQYTNVVIYEPQLKVNNYLGMEIQKDLLSFCENCDIIIANRVGEELLNFKEKIYSRDVFNSDY
jgi:UDPglucose 6-dehydrogenase